MKNLPSAESLHRVLGDLRPDEQWYQHYPELLKAEKKAFDELGFEFSFDEKERATWSGVAGFNETQGEYVLPDLPYNPLKIRIVCQPDYPLSFPSVFDVTQALIKMGCDHANPEDDTLCYAFRPTTTLDFIHENYVADVVPVIQEFLLRWYVKQRTGNWPGGEHPHGIDAFILWEFKHGDFSLNALCPCALTGKSFKVCHLKRLEQKIRGINEQIAKALDSNKLAGNRLCYCGSGRTMKHCHDLGKHQGKPREVHLMRNYIKDEKMMEEILGVKKPKSV